MNTVPRGTARHGLWGPGDMTAVIVTVAGMLTIGRVVSCGSGPRRPPHLVNVVNVYYVFTHPTGIAIS